MSEKISHSNYSAKDIERYLLGKMSHEEMYAIEKAALDDLLLAEAIEGYEGMQQANWDEALEELKEKLAGTEKATIVDMGKFSFAKWWRVAAAVLLLISSVAIVYILIPNNPPVVIAETKKLPTNEANNIVIDSAVFDTALTAKDDIAQSKQLAETIDPKATNKQPTQKIIATIETSKDRVNDDYVYTPNVESVKNLASKREANYPSKSTEDYKEVAASNLTNADLNANSIVEKEQLSINQTQSQANNQAVSTIQNNNYLNGKVVGVDINSLPNAQVITDLNRPPVNADANFNFKIPSADTSMVVVGYGGKKITPQNNQPRQKIVLDEAAVELKELNSSKSKAHTKKDAMRKAKQQMLEVQEVEQAEPLIGWVEYNNYLRDNVTLANIDADKLVHGIVEVLVVLNKNGLVTKATVTKSLCVECDAVVIRLVKQGSKWKVKNKKDNKVSVKVNF
jgi:hypothetical protein